MKCRVVLDGHATLNHLAHGRTLLIVTFCSMYASKRITQRLLMFQLFASISTVVFGSTIMRRSGELALTSTSTLFSSRIMMRRPGDRTLLVCLATSDNLSAHGLTLLPSSERLTTDSSSSSDIIAIRTSHNILVPKTHGQNCAAFAATESAPRVCHLKP